MFAASATLLDCPAERAWEEAQTTRLFTYVTAPLVAFEPVEPPALPERWAEGSYLVRMRLLGLLPLGTQWIVITRSVVDATSGRRCYELRDNGHGGLIAT